MLWQIEVKEAENLQGNRRQLLHVRSRKAAAEGEQRWRWDRRSKLTRRRLIDGLHLHA